MLFSTDLLTNYIYLAIIRNTRRRVYQTRIRRLALFEERPYIIVSRSFAHSESLMYSLNTSIGHYIYISFTTVTLLDAVIDDLSYHYPVIALGDRDVDSESRASNALYINELPDSEIDWSQVFAELAGESRCVLVIPGYTSRFLRKLEILQKNHLGCKTLVYM